MPMANMKRSSSASLLALAYYLFIICFSTHALSTSPVTTPPIIPITVLSGFLGTGKTTLLQEMLENKQGLRIGVVVNDVASVNIDSKLVAGKTTATNKNGERDANSAAVKAMPDGMVELQNGCACCSLSDELLSSVANLVTLSDLRGQQELDDAEDGTTSKNNGQFHHIVIELSGVADPKAIRAKFQQAVMEQMPLMERVQLDTMVSLIDCSTFSSYFQSPSLMTPAELPELFPEEEDLATASQEEEWMKDLPPKLLEAVLNSMRRGTTDRMDGEEPEGVADLLTSQTETADLVVLNKQDLVDAAQLNQLEEIVQALNPRAQILVTSYGKVPLNQVLGVARGEGVAMAGAVDDHREYVQAVMDQQQSMAQIEAPTMETVDCTEPACTDPSHSHSHAHDHEPAAKTVECNEPACTDPSHTHAHSHDHEPAVKAVECNEPACTDPSHTHAHSHDHEPAAKAVECTDPSHSHSHSHDHEPAAKAVECNEPACTDPSHSHSHSHDHVVGESACSDPVCTDPTHDHSHSHDHAKDPATYAGIGSFVYRARRPFHPGRLVSFLRYLPVVRGVPDGSGDKEDSLIVPTVAQKALANCVRSKGFCWCANSHSDALYWSHAGSSYELKCLGQWWATLPRDQWPPGIDEYVLQDFDNMAHDDASNPVGVGDRRQEVVFIGPTLGEASAQRAITESLNQCMLNDEEMEEYTALSKANSEQGKLAARFANILESKYVTY